MSSPGCPNRLHRCVTVRIYLFIFFLQMNFVGKVNENMHKISSNHTEASFTGNLRSLSFFRIIPSTSFPGSLLFSPPEARGGVKRETLGTRL